MCHCWNHAQFAVSLRQSCFGWRRCRCLIPRLCTDRHLSTSNNSLVKALCAFAQIFARLTTNRNRCGRKMPIGEILGCKPGIGWHRCASTWEFLLIYWSRWWRTCRLHRRRTFSHLWRRQHNILCPYDLSKAGLKNLKHGKIILVRTNSNLETWKQLLNQLFV